MPDAIIASRSSTDWNTELSGRSCPVVLLERDRSRETWPGAPSNSNVCTMPSSDGVPWKTPWNPYSLPSSSEWT